MRARIMKFLNRQDGFTLIEAILTVVIVGVAMIPISIVFTQTINTTRTTRKQFDANTLAQGYAEQIRSMTFDDFYKIFPLASESELELASDESGGFDAVGLNPIKQGYTLRLSYETFDDQSDYEAPKEAIIDPVDAIIMIPSDNKKDIYLQDGHGQSIGDSEHLSYNANSTRIIYIKLDRNTSYYEVYYRTSDKDIGSKISPASMTYSKTPKLKIVLGDEGTMGEGHGFDTTLQIDSNLKEEVKVYVFESDNTPINLKTQTLSGYASYSRNLRTSEHYDRIINVNIEIVDENSNKTLVELNTTKVKE